MERDETYRRKLRTIAEELAHLPEEPDRLSALETRGVLHAIQVAIDAAMDLAAMRVRDLGADVKDDYHNLDVMLEHGALDEAMADALRRLNGLRNAIVQKYNRFEERTVMERLTEIRSTLDRFAERLEDAI